jgi:hypothetical protein
MEAIGELATDERTTLERFRERAEAGLLVVSLPGDRPTRHTRQSDQDSETPTDGTEAVECWVGLLDRAESLMGAVDWDNPYVQRTARRALDSLYRYEHEMTPTARRLAREFVWLRDRDAPLPPAEERVGWERCRCRACMVERILGQPSIARMLPRVPPVRLARVEQAALQLPA